MISALKAFRDTELGLDELVVAVGRLLEAAPAPADGRVSEVPDARTLRYYHTIGLVTRPLRYDGRKAVYGYRHLLQAVAIKLLQAQGLSLAQIQRALAVATQAQLEAAIAPALGGWSDPQDQAVYPITSAPASEAILREPRIVAARISQASVLPAEPQAPAFDAEFGPPLPRSAENPLRPMVAVQLAPGVTVLIDPDLVDEPEELLARIAHSLEGGEEGS